MIYSLWSWLQGYIIVRLRGAKLEAFLNLVTQAGFNFLDIERLAVDVLIIKLRPRDYARLRPYLPGRGIKAAILERKGFPFLLQEVKTRFFFLIGFALALALLFHLSSFIWFIELQGGENIPFTELEPVLEELDLKTGVKRKNLEPLLIETELLLQFPDLAWAELVLKGSSATLKLIERTKSLEELKEAGSIYTEEAGLVTEVLVLKGQAMVRKGQTVKEGDLLIKGLPPSYGAEGFVKARVWRTGVGEASLINWQVQETNKRAYRFVFKLGPLEIPLGKSYGVSTHLKEEKTYCLPLGKSLLPLSFTKIKYREVEYIAEPIPYAEGVELARKKAWQALGLEEYDTDDYLELKEESFLISDQNGVRVEISVELEEEIGILVNE